MRVPPRPRSKPLLDNGLLVRIGLAGGFSALAALVIMELHPGGFEHARWLAYSALVAGQAVRANANRSLRLPVLTLRPNPLLLVGGVVTVAVQALIPYLPPVAAAFRATPLDPSDWLLVAVVALLPAVAAELIRTVGRRRWVA